MANQWFKFYGAEYLSDPKMDRLTVQERSCWLTLLCMASQTDGIIKFISVEGLLTKSGIKFDPYDSTEWDDAQSVLKTFEQYEMINVKENGIIEIKNWNKRQEQYLTGAERVAKHRRNKEGNDNADDNTNDNAISLSNDNEELPMTGYERLKKYRQNKAKKVIDNVNVTNDVTDVTLEERDVTDKSITSEENRVEENTKSEETSQVNNLIDLFKVINPSYSKLFANKTQRNACERMLKLHGLQKLQGLIEILPDCNRDKYAPVITTPVQLEDKLGQLIAYGQKKQNNQPLMI